MLARYQRIVDEVNATLAPFETIKRFAVVAEEWSIETDELTPSMKLKRRVVEKKYAAEIAEFYKDEATATSVEALAVAFLPEAAPGASNRDMTMLRRAAKQAGGSI